MMKRTLFVLMACLSLILLSGRAAMAYPFYAQMAYENPREATGKIACANCHLGQKPALVEVPQAVTPGKIFEVSVGIPYDLSSEQVLGDGSKGGLNVGAVVILPEGFRLATEEEMSPEQAEEISAMGVIPYSDDKPNILLVGPLPGEEYQEIAFPIKAPDPREESGVAYMKYKVYVGANRGRGQLNPDGSLSNNTVFVSPITGTIQEILTLEDPSTDLPTKLEALVDVSMASENTRVVTFVTDSGIQAMAIPAGPDLLVQVGDSVKEGQPLTNNPNVGGFGQAERDLVFQNPDRIKGLIAFLGAIFVAQVMLVLKKKQVELIQAAEIVG